jgi:multidrug efflux system membrane fusion protein
VSVDNLIDPATGTIKMKAEFPNADRQLFPNQFVNARLELDMLRDVVTVPSSAIQRGSQGLFVYIVQANRTVALRPVTLGPVDGQRLAIADGVSPGELVVVDGIDRLREGAAVDLIERPDFQAPAAAKPPAAGARPGGQRRRPAGPR